MQAIRKIWNTLGTVLVILMVVLAVLLVGVRLVGLTPYAVLSGSMEPTYHVGSLIYVRSVDPASVTKGMPLTFVVDESLLVATHRVVDVFTATTRQEPVLDENGQPVLDEDGEQVMQEVPLDEMAYYFQTKGDANADVDGSLVYYKNVVGTPVFSIPYLGYLSSFLQTKKGLILGVSAAIVILILTFLPDLLRTADEPQQKQSGKRKKKTAGSPEAQPADPDPVEMEMAVEPEPEPIPPEPEPLTAEPEPVQPVQQPPVQEGPRRRSRRASRPEQE